MNMTALRESIKRHEGLRLKPYVCTAGKLTIGFGRNLEDRGISEPEALQMLDADLAACVAELHRAIPGWQKHSPERQNVLVEMVYNLGMPRLLTFRKFLAALDQANYPQAAAEMLDSKWAQQVGQRAKTMAKQMETGTIA